MFCQAARWCHQVKRERTERQTVWRGETSHPWLPAEFTLPVKLYLLKKHRICRSVAERTRPHMYARDTPKAAIALSGRKKKATWCSLNADCSDSHFFLTKLCDVIKKELLFHFPSVQQAENVFPLSRANVTNSVLCDFCQRHQMSLLI